MCVCVWDILNSRLPWTLFGVRSVYCSQPCIKQHCNNGDLNGIHRKKERLVCALIFCSHSLSHSYRPSCPSNIYIVYRCNAFVQLNFFFLFQWINCDFLYISVKHFALIFDTTFLHPYAFEPLSLAHLFLSHFFAYMKLIPHFLSVFVYIFDAVIFGETSWLAWSGTNVYKCDAMAMMITTVMKIQCKHCIHADALKTGRKKWSTSRNRWAAKLFQN